MSATNTSDHIDQAMSENITPGEAAHITGIPASTLRRYVARFGDHLSPSARKQRGREFTRADLDILFQIRDLAAQGFTLQQIEPKLGGVVEHTEIQEELSPQTALAIINRIAQLQTDQADRLAALEAQIAELQARLDRPRSFWDIIRGK